MDTIFKEFKLRFEQIEEGLASDFLHFEQLLLDLEEEVFDATYTGDERYKARLLKLLKQIKNVKEEYDFYDADAERAYMFPNGEDED